MSPTAGPTESSVWRLQLDDYVGALCVDPHGIQVVAGSLAGEAVLVDNDDGRVLARLATHPGNGGLGGVSAVAWDAQGDRFAVGGHDGVVHVYDRAGGHLRSEQLEGWVAALEWSPTGPWLAVAAGRRLTLIADPVVDAPSRTFDPVGSTITDVAWATNGRRVGVTAYGGVTWYDPDDTSSATPVRTYAWKGSLLSLEMSPTGRWACGGAQDASVHLWRLWSGDDLSMSGYPAKIEHLAFGPDGRWMAVACLGEVTVWDFGGNGPAGTTPASGEAHDRHIETLAWRPDGEVLATGGADGVVALWQAPRRQGAALTPFATIGLGGPGRGDDRPAVGALRWTPGNGPGSLPELVIARADGTVTRDRPPSR